MSIYYSIFFFETCEYLVKVFRDKKLKNSEKKQKLHFYFPKETDKYFGLINMI